MKKVEDLTVTWDEMNSNLEWACKRSRSFMTQQYKLSKTKVWRNKTQKKKKIT